MKNPRKQIPEMVATWQVFRVLKPTQPKRTTEDTFQGWLAGFLLYRTNTTIENHRKHIPGMIGSFPRSRTNTTIENHRKHIPGMVGRFSACYNRRNHKEQLDAHSKDGWQFSEFKKPTQP
jgi:hypothetical protein